MPTENPVPKKSKRKKRRLLLFGIPALLLLLLIVSTELTSTSKFCSACHYMKPFYESWKTSSHAEFECKSCHYPPGFQSFFRTKIEGLVMVGRYWTKLYVKSKPWAEIQDESCLRPECHDRRLLEGTVEFGKVVFDHTDHFDDLKRGKRLRCTSCHSQIVQGEHITVTPESCYLCHFKDKAPSVQVGECALCHRKDNLLSNKDRFDHTPIYDLRYSCDKCHSQIVVGDGGVPRENCYKCHFERDRLDQYDDTDLMHTMHIYTNKIECEQCHDGIQHRIVKDIETLADCQSCHVATHEPQKILFVGEGGKGVSHATPNLMLEKGLSCRGCHIFHETSEELIKSDTFTAGGEACESCHGKGFDRILKNWEEATEKRLLELRAVSRRTAREIRSSTGATRETAETLLEEALFNIDIVEKGKSVHNMAYSQELLMAALDSMRMALTTVGSSYQPEALSLLTRDTPHSCLNCHEGIEELSASIYGVRFSHRSHVINQKMDCGACHSNARTHGELTSSKANCASCHHDVPVKDCARCHTIQKTMYEGGTLGDLDIPKDIMAEAEATCEDCHLGDNTIVKPGASSCVACHDEDYRGLFEEWKGNVSTLVDQIRVTLHDLYKKSLTADERTEIRKIEDGLRMFDLDGSSGLHNYLFTEEYLGDVLKTLNIMNQEKGEKK